MVEGVEQLRHSGMFKIVGRLLALILQVDVAVGDLRAVRCDGPDQVIDAVDVLQVHGDALEAIGELTGDGVALQAAGLLEIGELGHLHAVEPDFPAQAPGTQGGRFPVVFDEANVMHQRVDAEVFERAQVERLQVGGEGFITTWN